MTTIEDVKQSLTAQILENSNSNVLLHNQNEDKLEDNYTINFFPNLGSASLMHELMNSFKSKFPNNCFIAEELIHSTLVGLIPLEVDQQKIIEFMKQNIPIDLTIKYQGLNCTQKGVAFVGFAENLGLKGIRDSFTSDLSDKSLQYWGYYQNIAWATFMRFQEQAPSELYSFLLENIYTNFGKYKGRIQLLENSSRMLEGSKVIFEL